jgi:hypothetical protein
LPQLGPVKDGPEGPGPEAGHVAEGAPMEPPPPPPPIIEAEEGGGGITGGGGLDAIGGFATEAVPGGGAGGRSEAVTVTVTTCWRCLPRVRPWPANRSRA